VFGTIVAVFVVFAIFGVVGSVFTMYVWLVDPRRRVARAALRARREAPGGPAA